MGSNIYALIAETMNVIFSSSTSSSSSQKESGAMIAKLIELIKTEYDATTDFTSFDSAKLISSIIDESVSLLSGSSISSSSSFSSGLLLVNVATGVTGGYTRASSYSDSGRITTVSITSINKDITDTKVMQPELFSKIGEAVLEKFTSSGAVIVRAVKAINDQLGADVDKDTESVTLYVNTMKAISDEFEDITTVSDDGKKEAKAMVAAVEVLEGSLPDSIDTGDIILQIVTDIHELYDPEDTRDNGPQQFIEGILQSIANFFHGNPRRKGKLKKIQKNVSKALRQVLFT